MRPSSLHYFPSSLPFILLLAVAFAVLVALVELGILQYAYEKMGVNRRYVFSILFLSLVGSAVNIPVAEIPEKQIVSDRVITYFGVPYVVPEVQKWPRTIVAVNLGGAVIPVLLSAFLLVKHRIYARAAIGVAIVTVIVHPLARPVPGLGIAMPSLLPPIVAALTALLLSRQNAPALAYICGSLGTLIGADLLNLAKLQGLDAPIASIGGAGTYDGIFLTGILAVLLA